MMKKLTAERLERDLMMERLKRLSVEAEGGDTSSNGTLHVVGGAHVRDYEYNSDMGTGQGRLVEDVRTRDTSFGMVSPGPGNMASPAGGFRTPGRARELCRLPVQSLLLYRLIGVARPLCY